jgi:hypothetical protein
MAGSDEGLLIEQPWALHDGPGGTSLTLTLTTPAGSCGDRLATIDSLDISFNEGPTA